MSNEEPVPAVTRTDLVSGLRGVGVRPGETLLVHSSLRSFGRVAGGADTVIDALLEAVGPDGTVVMPAFTWRRYHAEERVTYDMARDDVREEVGLIPETFRRRPEALRSRHVCHSVTAIGPQAEAVMGEGVSPFGPGSTFQALYDRDAGCLLLGVGFTVCTALHAAEEIVQIPYRYYRDFKGSTVVLPDGSRVASASVEYLRKDGYRNDFAKMQGVLEQAGVLRTARVGGADVVHAGIRDIIDIAVRRLRADKTFLLADEASVLPCPWRD